MMYHHPVQKRYERATGCIACYRCGNKGHKGRECLLVEYTKSEIQRICSLIDDLSPPRHVRDISMLKILVLELNRLTKQYSLLLSNFESEYENMDSRTSHRKRHKKVKRLRSINDEQLIDCRRLSS